jgi:hypothetical protein
MVINCSLLCQKAATAHKVVVVVEYAIFTGNTAVGIRCAHHATPSIRKSLH